MTKYLLLPYLQSHPWVLALLLVWVLPWKGYALWKSARNSQSGWFVVLLVVNTLAILEIIYIFFFSKPKNAEPSRGN